MRLACVIAALVGLTAPPGAHAFEVLGLRPEQPTSASPLLLDVRFDPSDRQPGFASHTYGSVIQAFVQLSDVAGPPEGTRFVTYALGTRAAGTYEIQVYSEAPFPILRRSFQVTVRDPEPIPALTTAGIGALSLGLFALVVTGSRLRFSLAGSSHRSLCVAAPTASAG